MPKLGMEDIRKEQVIASTKNCIISKGLSNLSMKDIAKEAGVSTGIIYHYFNSKEDLLMQVLKVSFRQSHEKVMETVELLQDPEEKLMKHLENINSVSRDNPEYMAVFLNYLGEGNHNAEVREILNKFFNNVIEYTRQNLGDVSFEGSQLNNLPVMIIAMGIGLGTMWTMNNQLYDMDEMEDSIKELISSYVKGKKGGSEQ